jgi:hypothetical protein
MLERALDSLDVAWGRRQPQTHPRRRRSIWLGHGSEARRHGLFLHRGAAEPLFRFHPNLWILSVRIEQCALEDRCTETLPQCHHDRARRGCSRQPSPLDSIVRSDLKIEHAQVRANPGWPAGSTFGRGRATRVAAHRHFVDLWVWLSLCDRRVGSRTTCSRSKEPKATNRQSTQPNGKQRPAPTASIAAQVQRESRHPSLPRVSSQYAPGRRRVSSQPPCTRIFRRCNRHIRGTRRDRPLVRWSCKS